MGTRRLLGLVAGISVWSWLAFGGLLAQSAEVPTTEANRTIELSFTAQKEHSDPFNTLELDVTFTPPSGKTIRIPAFWAGGSAWRARYSSSEAGEHHYVTSCTDAGDKGLHEKSGSVSVRPYTGKNPLFQHGPLRVAADHRHLEHQDGTPFFWLGDTWWMGLCERLKWPAEFATLAADRTKKGFNVVQIVAGLYPDMPAFDPRGQNEAGFPWEKEYTRIRPEYFDKADDRLNYLVDQGIVPCIVMAWGYHQPWLGTEKMKKHVRYVMARYGSLPVVWCMAGEVNLPYYLEKGFPLGGEKQAAAWKDVIKYGRAINGQGRLITVHPTGLEPLSGRLLYQEQDLLDFDFLQTGHGRREVLPPTIRAFRASLAAVPPMPVLNSEVCYEALLGTIPADIPRLMFWTNMLTGAAGHTYGANGIWQLNRQDKAYGASPHGGNYGTIPWNESMNLPGSEQLGMGKKFLESTPWNRLQPHNDWASWGAEKNGTGGWGDWIWYPEGDPTKNAPEEARYFRKTFDISPQAKVARATLRASADDSFTLYLNGKSLGSHGNWSTGRDFPAIEDLLRSGKNVIAVRAENSPGPKGANPAGLSCRLVLEFEDGKTTVVSSDDSWRTQQRERPDWQNVDFSDESWSQAKVVARFGEGPWGSRVGVDDEYFVPYSAGIPGELRVVYVPAARPILLHHLKVGAHYKASYFDPVTGKSQELGDLPPDSQGNASVSPPRGCREDWVLLVKDDR